MVFRNFFKIFSFTIILLMVFTVGRAQTITNVSASRDPTNSNQVIITYNLLESGPNQIYRIELKSSNDNYASVLQLVSGDVGDNITPGNNRRIIWRAREELGLFRGNISFEVNSTLLSSPLRLNSPKLSDTFNPGNSIPIEWEGGFRNSTIEIDLFKSNIFNRQITTTPNVKKYEWVVPGDLPGGTDYKIKLYESSAPADAVMSNNFSIRAAAAAAITPEATQTQPKEEKVKKKGGKTGLIIGAIVVAGGAAAYFLTRDTDPVDNGNPGGDTDVFSFPSPPGTPDGSKIQKKSGLINLSISF